MIHPLLQLLITQPSLIGDHVEAYAELVSDEVGKVSTIWIWRIVFYAAAGLLALVGLLFVGISLMLWGASSTPEMSHPWLLWVVPLLPFVLAGICIWRAKADSPHEAFGVVKQQVNADMAMLREVGAAS